jgi:leucyl/phenylalanyl-tRNA--protein transferase
LALVRAYAAGLFPMADGEDIAFYRADPRAVIPVESPRLPRSVARALRRRSYRIELNRDFAGVLTECAAGRDDGEWLSPALRLAYARLHLAGVAHSVECWDGPRLVGGLFGVALGGLFTSESMFHRAPDAGNVVLVATAERLRERRFALWDIQMASVHTRRFGAIEIPDREYRRRLAAALALEREFT